MQRSDQVPCQVHPGMKDNEGTLNEPSRCVSFRPKKWNKKKQKFQNLPGKQCVPYF